MSARVPVGATNRSDLFGGSGRQQVEEAKTEQDNVDGDYIRDDDPMQLEHMLGYAGDYRGTVITSPKDENVYIRRFEISIIISYILINSGALLILVWDA